MITVKKDVIVRGGINPPLFKPNQMKDKQPPPPFTLLEKATFWIMVLAVIIMATAVILKEAEKLK